MGRVVLVLTCGVIGCSTPDPSPSIPPHATPLAQAIGLGMSPMSVDDRGVPRLLQTSPSYLGPSGPPAVAALGHLEQLAPAWGVETMPALSALGEVPLGNSTIVRVDQRIAGLPIDGGELRVLVRPTGELIAVNGTLIDDSALRAAPRFELDDAGAVAAAVANDQATSFDARTLTRSARGWTGRSGLIEVPLAAAKRKWVRHGGQLIAGWIVEAYVGRSDSTHSDLIRSVVAGDGRVLERTSLVADVAFKYRVFAETVGDLRPLDGPIVDVSPHPTGIPDGGFPGFVAPQLVSVDGLNHPGGSAVPDSWLPSNRTETFGNNVEAYADLNAPSGLTFGDFRATTTSALSFDRTFDPAAGPLTSQQQQMASITSLFYVINWLHDFWYDAGFTEAAGNAQDSNFGRGGEDRDAMLAEAQDNALGGSRNNANMSTPSDGLAPRMQVFLWTGLDEHTLSLQPSGRAPANGIATYGNNTFDITAEVVLADDGEGANPSDLCEDIVKKNEVVGKIVLVDRGLCTFESKALKIQTAGGVGMLLANNNANNPPTMGDDVNTTEPITIGQLSILQSEGVTLKQELLAGNVTATMHRLVGPELDGAVDATLIAHEFGHYLHHRLHQCTTRLCAAISEGWGDFLSLMIMARAGDDLTGAYPFAVYATRSFSDDAQYFGIRRAPYSVDPAINALSFRHMAAGTPLPETHPFLPFGVNNEVHNAGEIWTAAMWDAYVALQQTGTSTFDEVRANMARYVVGGLLLAPVDATPTETRDAILLAARASSQADHDTLAAAFAGRGLGSCAVSMPRDSISFAGIVESLEVRANVIAEAPVVTAFTRCDGDQVIDAGETGRIVLAISNRGGKTLAGATATLTTTTAGVTVSSPPVALDLASYDATAIAFDFVVDPAITEPLDGAFELSISGGDACQNPLTIAVPARLNVDDVVARSATDTFDAGFSPWQSTFVAIWQLRRDTPLDGNWHGTAPAVFSDGALESPPLTAGGDALTLTFTHRYAFETANGSVFDGGVIEYSTDGSTWIDVMTLVPTIPYGTTPIAGVGNALAGRVGFTGNSPGYPDSETIALDFGTQLANQMFKIRFRLASDNTNASPGWDVDDVAFTGLVGTPFPVQIADATSCGNEDAPPDAGTDEPPIDGGCCGTGTPSSGLWALLVLMGLRRRR